MSEYGEHLTDEDLEAIEAIVDGSVHRQHGEALLAMFQEGDKRHEEQARSLLDAIGRATMAQENDDCGGSAVSERPARVWPWPFLAPTTLIPGGGC